MNLHSQWTLFPSTLLRLFIATESCWSRVMVPSSFCMMNHSSISFVPMSRCTGAFDFLFSCVYFSTFLSLVPLQSWLIGLCLRGIGLLIFLVPFRLLKTLVLWPCIGLLARQWYQVIGSTGWAQENYEANFLLCWKDPSGITFACSEIIIQILFLSKWVLPFLIYI